MSTMNKRATRTSSKRTAVSYNGNVQVLKTSHNQLLELLSMSFFGKDNYYETHNVQSTRLNNIINELVAGGELDYVANVIHYARTELNMRSMPLAGIVYFARALHKNNKRFDNMKYLVCDTIQRADQITDLYAFALNIFGAKNNIPLSIKKGVALAFNKFDEYQFSKYNRNGTVKLSDVLRIVHPKPLKEGQGELFAKIINDNLATANTWEVNISKAGETAKETGESVETVKASAWKKLIDDDKLGYMAMLRNLRNLEQLFAQTDETFKKVLNRISDKQAVLRSKQLPFRFLSAMEHTSRASTQGALSTAVDHALANVPSLGDNTVIVVDTSGSMGRFESSNSPVRTASLFGAALAKASALNGSDVYLIACATYPQVVKFNPNDSLTTIAKAIATTDVGHGTNLHEGVRLSRQLCKNPDSFVILSDMQVNSSSGWNSYSGSYLKDTVKVAFDLSPYASSPVTEMDGWYQLTGFSEKIFDFVDFQRDKESIASKLSGSYEPKFKL